MSRKERSSEEKRKQSKALIMQKEIMWEGYDKPFLCPLCKKYGRRIFSKNSFIIKHTKFVKGKDQFKMMQTNYCEIK